MSDRARLACSPRSCSTIKSMRNPLSFQTNRLSPVPSRFARRGRISRLCRHRRQYGLRDQSGRWRRAGLSRNLGTPVPNPLNCGINGPNVGIKSTPVIDLAAKTFYVIAYTLMSGTPTYQLFALNLNDLTNKIPPATVAASHTLSDGTTYNFNATYQRQRPALLSHRVIPLGLHSSGNIYAAFGSFCDYGATMSRGWVLGWQASTLTPLRGERG